MKLPQQIAQADEPRKIPPISTEKSTGLCVTVIDTATGNAIQGIPVWCKQKDTEWEYNALTTNRLGQVTFYRMKHGLANYGVNKGGYHGYSEIKSKQCTIYDGMITHRKEKLTKTGEPGPDPEPEPEPEPGKSKAEIFWILCSEDVEHGVVATIVERGRKYLISGNVQNRGSTGRLYLKIGLMDKNKNWIPPTVSESWSGVRLNDGRKLTAYKIIPIDYSHDIIYVGAEARGEDGVTVKKEHKMSIKDIIPKEGFAEVYVLNVEVQNG